MACLDACQDRCFALDSNHCHCRILPLVVEESRSIVLRRSQTPALAQMVRDEFCSVGDAIRIGQAPQNVLIIEHFQRCRLSHGYPLGMSCMGSFRHSRGLVHDFFSFVAGEEDVTQWNCRLNSKSAIKPTLYYLQERVYSPWHEPACFSVPAVL
jgi:hypothetical protein